MFTSAQVAQASSLEDLLIKTLFVVLLAIVVVATSVFAFRAHKWEQAAFLTFVNRIGPAKWAVIAASLGAVVARVGQDVNWSELSGAVQTAVIEEATLLFAKYRIPLDPHEVVAALWDAVVAGWNAANGTPPPPVPPPAP